MLRTRISGAVPALLIASLAACGGNTAAPPTISSTAGNAVAGPVTPDPAPTAGPAPADVIATLGNGGDAERICFGWSPAGDVMCATDVSSIQGGATLTVRVLGPHAADFVYYRSPEDQQFFEVDNAKLDGDALDRAKARAADGFQGWAGPDVELEPGATVIVGNHTLRRTRTEVGMDGDDTTGAWPTFKDVVELRCGERWVPVTLDGEVFGHPVEAPLTAVVALGDSLLFTASVSWGIEGDHGGGTDAALIDAARVCR